MNRWRRDRSNLLFSMDLNPAGSRESAIVNQWAPVLECELRGCCVTSSVAKGFLKSHLVAGWEMSSTSGCERNCNYYPKFPSGSPGVGGAPPQNFRPALHLINPAISAFWGPHLLPMQLRTFQHLKRALKQENTKTATRGHLFGKVNQEITWYNDKHGYRLIPRKTATPRSTMPAW